MRLIQIQSELKAPKGQTNKFGGYKYRSCEDILEALKPLLLKYEMQLTLSDDIIEVGGRVYVKATATLHNLQAAPTANKPIVVSAFAREAETKKGMDEAQVTGSASSYARKYALNGLFAIDDTKDADTQDNTQEAAPAPTPKQSFEEKHLKTPWNQIPWPWNGEYKGHPLSDIVASGETELLSKAFKHYEAKATETEGCPFVAMAGKFSSALSAVGDFTNPAPKND